MSVDCCLKTEAGRYGFDHASVFDDVLEQGTIYSRSEFVRLVEIGLKMNPVALDTYRRHWLTQALIYAGERNVILNEGEHYHGKPENDFFLDGPLSTGAAPL